MSARPGVIASAKIPADGGESPNRYKPVVTAEVRCHWPPLATDEQIKEALNEAYWKAVIEIERGPEGRQL